MSNDVPYLNETEIRGLLYIAEINQELDQSENATIAQLTDHSEWRSSYFTNTWKSLSPQLVNREKDGQNTRLGLTKLGWDAVSAYRELNMIFDEAGL